MREPRNCPLPEGWDTLPYDFDAMFDLEGKTALRYDGKKAVPAWDDVSPNFFHFKMGPSGPVEMIVNQDFVDDSLFADIARMKVRCCSELEITQYICWRLTSYGFEESDPATLDKFNEIMATRWLADSWAEHVDASTNRIEE